MRSTWTTWTGTTTRMTCRNPSVKLKPTVFFEVATTGTVAWGSSGPLRPLGVNFAPTRPPPRARAARARAGPAAASSCVCCAAMWASVSRGPSVVHHSRRRSTGAGAGARAGAGAGGECAAPRLRRAVGGAERRSGRRWRRGSGGDRSAGRRARGSLRAGVNGYVLRLKPMAFQKESRLRDRGRR